MKTDRIIQAIIAAIVGFSFAHAFRQPAWNEAMVSRLTTLEREVAEIRAQSRANVINALPPREPVLKIEIP